MSGPEQQTSFQLSIRKIVGTQVLIYQFCNINFKLSFFISKDFRIKMKKLYIFTKKKIIN